jgi:hypothetical protein
MPEPTERPDRSDKPDRPPQRVRIVLADAHPHRPPIRARRELEEQTGVGDVLVRGLVRAQLGLALRTGAVVVVGLGLLPLLFAVAPSVGDAKLFGIKIPWLLLGVFAYPFLLGVGWAYTRMSERNEREFTELVEKS